jgi:2-hydroxycyclohexanecarboxyl-CoA dehydrogenase
LRRLEDRVALVTGAGRGIGRAIAHRLAGEGALVGVADIDETTAKGVVAELEGVGQRAMSVIMDVTDHDQVNAAMSEFIAAAGGLHVIVNNAGWDKIEPFVQSRPETWDKVIAVNLRGPIHVTRAGLDHMLAERYGRIVNIGSDAGRVGSTGEAVYSACKGGLIAFSKTLAREVARKGITVNTVCPGPTATPLVELMMADNEKLLDSLTKAIPIGRIGEPEDLAGAVAFFASDDAAFVTGQTLSVSGGLTMS